MKPFLSAVLLSSALLAPPIAAQETRAVDTPNGVVELPADPQRIVVLNAVVAGSLYALGLDLFAVTEAWKDTTEDGYSAFWAEAAREQGTQVLPPLGDGINFERVLALEPDVIIGGGLGYPGVLTSNSYEALSAIAPTLIVDRAITDWREELRFIAMAFDREPEAEAAIAAYEARVEEVRAAIALPPQPTSFLLAPTELGGEGYVVPETTATPLLFASLGFTLDPVTEHFPDLAGGRDWLNFSLENTAEIFSAPTLIVIEDPALSPILPVLAEDPIYSRIPALAEGNAYAIPAYAYRFDYYGALATLDLIEDTFAR